MRGGGGWPGWVGVGGGVGRGGCCGSRLRASWCPARRRASSRDGASGSVRSWLVRPSRNAMAMVATPWGRSRGSHRGPDRLRRRRRAGSGCGGVAHRPDGRLRDLAMDGYVGPTVTGRTGAPLLAPFGDQVVEMHAWNPAEHVDQRRYGPGRRGDEAGGAGGRAGRTTAAGVESSTGSIGGRGCQPVPADRPGADLRRDRITSGTQD